MNLLKIPSYIIAFGDIHGCYQAAQTAISLAENLGAQAIFLGDYVDRGPSSVRTLQALIKAKARYPQWVFLRGNHDQMLLDLIEGEYEPDDIGIALGNLRYDFSQTEDSLKQWQNLGKDEQGAIVAFLESTELYYEIEEYVFLHGVLRNTQQGLQEKSSEELLWNYESEPLWYGKWFVHGHWPIKKVFSYGKGININTQCGYNGTLTGLLIDTIAGKPLKTFTIGEDGKLLSEDSFSEQG